MVENEDEEVTRLVEGIVDKRLQKLGNASSHSSGMDLGEFAKFVGAMKTTKEALESPIERAITDSFTTKIIDQVIPSMNRPPASSSFLDSNFMTAMGSEVGKSLPSLVDTLVRNFGKDQASNMINNLQNTFGGKAQTENEVIMSLDIDNPAHLHQYMSLRKINDVNIAKKSFIYEKEKLMNNLRSNTNANIENTNSNSESNNSNIGNSNVVLENYIQEQNQLLKELIKGRNEDKSLITELYNEVNKLKNSTSTNSTLINESKSTKFVDDTLINEHVDTKTIDNSLDDNFFIEKEKVSPVSEFSTTSLYPEKIVPIDELVPDKPKELLVENIEESDIDNVTNNELASDSIKELTIEKNDTKNIYDEPKEQHNENKKSVVPIRKCKTKPVFKKEEEIKI